jgi:serine/threonine protein kinase
VTLALLASGTLNGVVETIAGRYRLVERLGAGGMSVVWRGYDEVLGRPVAVKLLAAEMARDPDLRGRVLREARAAARLSHPHITNVYDYGEAADGTPYVVMELVDGQSLAQRIASGPVPWRSAVRVAAQVASALAAAHAQGLVHRDVTPANVMLSRGGVKVVDFGIAAAVGERDRAVLGTPSYLAPEQRAGGPAQAATDVYALGLLLYHAATGRLPRPPGLQGVPRDGAAVIAACLSTNPDARPGSAVLARRLAELADAAARQPVVASAPAPRRTPVGAGTRVLPEPVPEPWPPPRSRHWPWTLSGLVVLVLTFLAGVVFAGGRQHGVVQANPGGPPSPAPSPTPSTCAVMYKVTASVSNEFGADVSIRNTGTTDITGWTLVFDLPGEQRLRFGWAGQWDQKDRTVTVRDLIYNAGLGAGKSVSIGFVGTRGGKAKPGRFTLNGASCDLTVS